MRLKFLIFVIILLLDNAILRIMSLHRPERSLASFSLSKLLPSKSSEEIARSERISDLERESIGFVSSRRNKGISHVIELIDDFKSSMAELTDDTNSKVLDIEELFRQSNKMKNL